MILVLSLWLCDSVRQSSKPDFEFTQITDAVFVSSVLLRAAHENDRAKQQLSLEESMKRTTMAALIFVAFSFSAVYGQKAMGNKAGLEKTVNGFFELVKAS